MREAPLPPTVPTSRAEQRNIYALLAAFSLVLAWHWMANISATDPWYRNTDMNIHNVADALSLNSGYGPGTVDQPGAPTKFLLALDFRIRNALGQLPTWTLKRFARSAEPLSELAQLVKVGRVHSRLLVIAIILLGAAFIGQVTRRFELACFTVVLLCGSSGLLFHGLLIRPELLCAGLGGILALHCAWLATTTARPQRRAVWLVLSGLCLGLALISKLPAMLYVALIFGWCCLAPLLPVAVDETAPADAPPRVLTQIFCLMISMVILILLMNLSPREDVLNPIATARLRLLAVVTALLPLVSLAGAVNRTGSYFSGRSLDLALLLSGILAAFVGWFGLLNTVLPVEAASIYMAKILNTTIYPDPLMALFTVPGAGHRLGEALKFYLETPVLFTATSILTLALAVAPSVSPRQRALLLVLLAQGLGMVLMMSKRLFLEQYSLFTQLPLLLIWALAFANLPAWLKARGQDPTARWPVALATTAALFLALTVPVALAPKYNGFQSDAAIPVRDLTVTFLYDHDAHPPAYLEVMRKRYSTRAAFAADLDRFLRDPSNRQ